MKRNIFFALLIFANNYTASQPEESRESIEKKIKVYAYQIVGDDAKGIKPSELSELKKNARVLNYDANILLPVINYVKPKSIEDEPVLALSKQLLGAMASRISNPKAPLRLSGKRPGVFIKISELIDELQYAEIKTDDFDKQELLNYLRKAVVDIANHVFSL